MCILSVIFNIAIYPLCKVNYLEEDVERVAEGTLKIKCELKYLPKVCWGISAFLMIIAICLHDDFGAVTVLLGFECFVAFLFCFVAILKRDRYYAIDENSLSFVKHGRLEWCHTWDEIDHARKRVISTGKSFIILYDIETKDGVKHRSLPSSLGRDLKEHVNIDKSLKLWQLWIIIAIVIVFIIFFTLGMMNK